MNTLQRTIWLVTMAGAMVAPSLAKAVTDIDISSYYTASWADPSGGPGGSNSERFNGSQIAAAAKNGNTDTGIVVGDWNGSYVETGPDSASVHGPST